jgi:hypothetical protein
MWITVFWLTCAIFNVWWFREKIEAGDFSMIAVYLMIILAPAFFAAILIGGLFTLLAVGIVKFFNTENDD